MSKRNYRTTATTIETFVDAKIVNHFERTAEHPAYTLYHTEIIFEGDIKGRKWKRDDEEKRCRR